MRENGSVPTESVPEEFFGTTAAQQGVWYGQLVDPDSPKYNIGGECFEIRGRPRRDVIRRSGRPCLQLCDSFNLEFVTEATTS
ncbi:hypothetical protein GTV15_04360, partial [Streptomyces sp. SID7803]|nr:hypothetical protein [Streptomyces sp. SID7803]